MLRDTKPHRALSITAEKQGKEGESKGGKGGEKTSARPEEREGKKLKILASIILLKINKFGPI